MSIVANPIDKIADSAATDQGECDDLYPPGLPIKECIQENRSNHEDAADGERGSSPWTW